MAYGLRVRDSSGTIILNTPDIVARVRYYNVVAANTSGNTTLSDIAGKTTHAFSIPLEGGKIAHSVSISGTTFSWTAQSTSRMASSESLVGVIITD